MKRRSIVAVASALLCAISVPLAAQESAGAAYTTETSVGYSFLRDVGENARAGMLVDFGKQVRTNVSVVGEVALNHFSTFEETYSQFAGGVRFGVPVSDRLRPFAQVMVGVQREFGSNGLNIQPGVGVSVRIARRIDAKIQGDFPLLRWEGENYKQFRLNAGIGLRLGR
jgi:hypothetical protein